jgi:hypothetical protein
MLSAQSFLPLSTYSMPPDYHPMGSETEQSTAGLRKELSSQQGPGTADLEQRQRRLICTVHAQI